MSPPNLMLLYLVLPFVILLTDFRCVKQINDIHRGVGSQYQ